MNISNVPNTYSGYDQQILKKAQPIQKEKQNEQSQKAAQQNAQQVAQQVQKQAAETTGLGVNLNIIS